MSTKYRERAREGRDVAARKKPGSKPVKLVDKAAKEKKAQEPLDQRLMKALSHPLRVTILDFMNDREWSPRELERETGEGLSQVSYHVKVLFDFELIELTRTAPRRGAVEHYYRAVERAFVPSGMAKAIPKSAQHIIGSNILKKIDDDVSTSLKSGKFYARDDWHTSWTPVDLDDQGCKDAEKLADEFVEGFLKIGAESANRRSESDGDSLHNWTTAAVLVFSSEHDAKSNGSTGKTRRRKKKRG